MMLKHTSHAVYDTTYHLVWCLKYRKGIFKDQNVKDFARMSLLRTCGKYRIDMLELEVAADHIHAMVSFPPSMSISDAVRKMKSVSAREIFQAYPKLKEQLWAGELWEDGYFARTAGDHITSGIIENYIRSHSRKDSTGAQLP